LLKQNESPYHPLFIIDIEDDEKEVGRELVKVKKKMKKMKRVLAQRITPQKTRGFIDYVVIA